MNDRLQKKCFLGSSLLHGLLCLIVVFGAAFSREEQPVTKTFEMVDPNGLPTDGPSRNGNPVVAAPVQPAPDPAPEPKPEEPVKPVEPVVPPPKPAPQPESDPVKPTPVTKPILETELKTGDIVVKPTAKKQANKEHKVVVDLNATTDLKKKRLEAEKQAREEQRREDEANADAYRKRMNSLKTTLRGTGSGLVSKVSSSASGPVVLSISGTGDGGPAFANYSSLVYDRYFRAWVAPENVKSDQSTTEAKVTVARDGSIISSDISKPSGDAALDRSVEQALRRVKSLPPFPSETQDSQRTFRIRFNLEAKQSIG